MPNNPKQVAHEFFSMHATASPNTVQKHAETVSVDPEFVLAVVREYSKLSLRAAKFNADVQRNWPEEKGY